MSADLCSCASLAPACLETSASRHSLVCNTAKRAQQLCSGVQKARRSTANVWPAIHEQCCRNCPCAAPEMLRLSGILCELPKNGATIRRALRAAVLRCEEHCWQRCRVASCSAHTTWRLQLHRTFATASMRRAGRRRRTRSTTCSGTPAASCAGCPRSSSAPCARGTLPVPKSCRCSVCTARACPMTADACFHLRPLAVPLSAPRRPVPLKGRLPCCQTARAVAQHLTVSQYRTTGTVWPTAPKQCSES